MNELLLANKRCGANRRDGACTVLAPLAEIYYSISPYVYCANNPVKYIDPTGMYFNDANQRRADEIDKNINKQVSKLYNEAWKLEKNGGDASDIYDRIGELYSSRDDLSDMSGNENVEFRYAKASDKNNPAGKGSPVAAPTGTNDAGHNVVTMFTEGKMGNQLHESRHGGQVARGEYSFDQRGNPTAGYGINSEVSAYRAQYAYDGKLTYLDASDASSQQIASAGIIPPSSTLTNISFITPNFVRNQISEFRSFNVRGTMIYGLVPIYKKLP